MAGTGFQYAVYCVYAYIDYKALLNLKRIT